MKNYLLIVILFGFIFQTTAQKKIWSLEEAVNYALTNNLSIKQAELTTDLRSEDIITAKGNRLPSLSANAGESFSFGSSIDNGNIRISGNRNSTSFGVNSSVTLFNGFRNLNTVKQAELGHEASILDLEKMKNDISLNIVNYYLNILFNKENIKVAQEQLQISKLQLEKVKQLIAEGVRPRGELLDAEATVANDEEKLVTAQNSLDLSLLSMAHLLQISHKDFDVQEMKLNILSPKLKYENTDAIFDKAVTEKPEIKSAELDVKNAVLGIDIAKSLYYPTVSLGYNFSTFYGHTEGLPNQQSFLDQFEDNKSHNINLSLNIPIFNGFKTKSGVSKANINSRLASYTLDNEKLKLRETIERAYTDAKAALNQYIASEKSVVAQQEAFKNAQDRYNFGAMTSFDFEQVRGRLVSAQSNFINAKYNFVFKTKLLEFYYGIPITMD
ncbi:MAG: TolC family protein [Flavobacteriaceae bacterium]|nr:TolC family protein [Flavobacteriaceae bacterium]